MTSSDSLEARLLERFVALGRTLAVAESITGGLISSRITDVPGSSRYFLGGVIAYDNEVKIGLLGVQRATIERHGAVSEQTAIEMARGARLAVHADVGVSVTGIAGPDGGSELKPVGTTCIGIATPTGERAVRRVFLGDRLGIKLATADAALQLLLDALESDSFISV